MTKSNTFLMRNEFLCLCIEQLPQMSYTISMLHTSRSDAVITVHLPSFKCRMWRPCLLSGNGNNNAYHDNLQNAGKTYKLKMSLKPTVACAISGIRKAWWKGIRASLSFFLFLWLNSFKGLKMWLPWPEINPKLHHEPNDHLNKSDKTFWSKKNPQH